MVLRKILQHCFKPPYSNLLYITRASSLSTQMSYVSCVSFKPFYNCNNNLQLVSSICNYACLQFNFHYSNVATSNEIQGLKDFILSEKEEYKIENEEELNNILSFLLSKGYTNKDIKEKFAPYIKYMDSFNLKFNRLSDIGSDVLLLLPLLSLPLNIIKLAAKQARVDKSEIEDFPNRIAYLCHYLELEPNELMPNLTKHSALLTMKFKRLDHKMHILKSANISSKYIVKDLWIFNYNEKLLGSRIQAAVKAGVELKPWMLRCSGTFFESMLVKYSETQRILGGDNMVNYVAKKLNCSTEYVDHMMERNKLMKSVNIPKMEQIINFLYEKGYTPQEIRIFPRVFCSSIQTLSKRFEKYQCMKSTLPPISQLCISSKKFEISLRKKGMT